MSEKHIKEINSTNIPTVSHDNLVEIVTKYIRNTHTILLIGEAGVGKSAVAKEIANVLNWPLIDRRLGQLEMGDLKGLFTIDKAPDSDKRVVKLALHDWLYKASTQPCVILLDEFNRADPQVMKEAFELIYDRSLYGEKIHPDCIIIACVNPDSDHYQVVDMNDKALKRRFWRVRYQPTREEWLRWARDNLHSYLYQFVSRDEHWDKYVDVRESDEASNPENSFPTRASWEKVNDALTNEKHLSPGERPLIENTHSEAHKHLFIHVVAGHLGQQVATALENFIEHDLAKLSAKQVVEDYASVRNLLWKEVESLVVPGQKEKEVIVPNDQLIALAEGVGNYLVNRKFKDQPVFFENINKFFDDIECRAEIRAKAISMIYDIWKSANSNTLDKSPEELAKREEKRRNLEYNLNNNSTGKEFLNKMASYIQKYQNIMKTKTSADSSSSSKRKGVDISA